MEIKQEKAALRKQIRHERRSLDPILKKKWDEEIVRRVLGLDAFKSAQVIFCYVACGGEPETRELISFCFASGKRVLVPLCGENGIMTAVEITSFADLSPGMYGILEPRGPAVDMGEIQFAIVPAVACDLNGGRLGQGGGYYDRFFTKGHVPHAVLCYEQFIYEDLPAEDHDQPVDMIITERRIIIGREQTQ